jgi:hypothetical protein
MKLKHVYLLLALVGTVLPYSALVPFLRRHGLDLRLLVEQLFANRISTFFALDVIVSSLVVILLVLVERRRLALRHWWAPLLAVFTVGVSLALPLFLWLRERALEEASTRG